MQMLLAATAGISLLGVAWVMGRPAVCLWDVPLEAAEAAAICLLMGLGFLGLVLFVSGQFYYTPLLCRIIVLAGIPAFVLPGFRTAVAVAFRTFAGSWPGRFGLGMLAFLFVTGLGEPVGTGAFDGIAYHLLGPKVWLREGRIGIVLEHFHTTFPATIEVLFGVLLGSAGPKAVDPFGALLAGILLLQVYGFATSLAGRTVGRLSVATAAGMPMVLMTPGYISAYVDIPFACFALAAVRIGLAATRTPHLLLTGCFLGFGAGTKYTGIIVAAVTALILAVKFATPANRKFLPGLVSAIVVGAIIASPWYIRNWYYLGTPIYPPPVFRGYFEARCMPVESAEAFLQYIQDRGKGMGRSALDFAVLPWRLTFFTDHFHGAAGGIGLVPLAFGIFGIWDLRRQPTALLLATWAFLLTLAWFVTQQEARFMVHVFAISAVFGSAGAVAVLRNSGTVLRILTIGTISVSLVHGVASAARDRRGHFHSAISPAHFAVRRTEMIPYCAAFDYLNRVVGSGRVLVLHPIVPPYYLECSYLKPLGNYGIYQIDGVRTPREVVGRARTLNVTYILDVRAPSEYDERVLLPFSVVESDGFRLVYSDETARVYAVE